MTKIIKEFRPNEKATLDDLSGYINYIIPVEDGDPFEASLLQGFARSLARHTGLIELINGLPSDIWELTPEGHEVRLARRMSGQAPVMWHGQSPEALTNMITPPSFPFVVLFLGPDHKIQKYQKWIDSHSFPLTVVAKTGGTISYEQFSLEKLKEAFLCVCDGIEDKIKPEAVTAAREQIRMWREPEERRLGYQIDGHNVVMPNLFALHTAGYRDMISGRFDKINGGILPYIDIIVKTTRSVLQERTILREIPATRYFRPPPSINLFAPAIYPHLYDINISDAPISREEKRRYRAIIRTLKQQSGYSYAANTEAQATALLGSDLDQEPKFHAVFMERAAELHLATACVGTLAASEISAVIRLPNAVNRTFGGVRQFAQHYHAKKTTSRKRQDEFRKITRAITTSIPNEFYEFIESSKDGIRLISDSHLEWATIRGLPLCIQKDITRIPVTPGNLFIDQISPKYYYELKTTDFTEILILSALQHDDPIGPAVDRAIDEFRPLFKKKLRIRTARIHNEADLINALNSFDGSIVIFDGHGGHEPNRAATLQLLDEEIDIWQLRGKRPRVPPIVVLSACDTHAADRNHATTANGFLSIGARTVLGSVFPINATDAASFVARLLYRIAAYIPAMHKGFNRSLTWMEIMGGMIRMQLMTDYCRQLQRKLMLDQDACMAIQLAGNRAINSGDEWPFEIVISELVKLGLDEKRAWHELRSATANSTAISYIQMGRPETIIVHPD